MPGVRLSSWHLAAAQVLPVHLHAMHASAQIICSGDVSQVVFQSLQDPERLLKCSHHECLSLQLFQVSLGCNSPGSIMLRLAHGD
jgi:hypothetical protein